MKLTRRSFTQIAAWIAASGAVGSSTSAWAQGPAPRAPDAMYQLVDFFLTTRYQDLPADVIEASKIQILDTVAVILPALHADGIRQLFAMAKDAGGKSESLVLGTSVRLPAEKAARINASMAATLEFDDTYEPSLMHASGVIIPTALSTANWVGSITGQELITVVALGNDITCRLSRAGSPGISPFIVGWDPTPMYGILGATLVAGRLMGLNRKQMMDAVGLAYHQMSGNAQASVDGTLGKRLGAGFGSYGGILSARLAQQGVFGSHNILQGFKGLFKQYHQGRVSEESLLGGLGKSYAGPDIAAKPYPCCRGGHVAIDGTMEIVKQHQLTPQQIAKVVIYSPPAEMMLLGAPIEKKRNPQTIVEAQFSSPWMVAAAIQDREVGLQHFTDAALQRQDLRQLTQLMFTVEDKTLVRPDGGPGFVRLEITTTAGVTHTKLVQFAKGDPKNPMTPAEYVKKFHECARAARMPHAQAQQVLQRLQHLENENDVSTLQAALAVTA